jgi:hypothetical protein
MSMKRDGVKLVNMPNSPVLVESCGHVSVFHM